VQHDDRKGTAKAVLQATLEGDYTGDAVDRHKVKMGLHLQSFGLKLEAQRVRY
jgi:hypothetical protein